MRPGNMSLVEGTRSCAAHFWTALKYFALDPCFNPGVLLSVKAEKTIHKENIYIYNTLGINNTYWNVGFPWCFIDCW